MAMRIRSHLAALVVIGVALMLWRWLAPQAAAPEPHHGNAESRQTPIDPIANTETQFDEPPCPAQDGAGAEVQSDPQEIAGATSGVTVADTAFTGGAVSGRVLRFDDGSPVATALTLVRWPIGGFFLRAESASRGEFEFTGLGEGTWRIQTGESQFVLAKEVPAIEIDEAHPTAVVDVLVTEGASISGRVFHADTNEGIGGARLACYDDATRSGGGGGATTTNADGTYEVSGLAAGFCTVRLESLGFDSGTEGDSIQVATKLGVPTPGVDFGISRSLCISGFVRSESGEAIDRARLFARDPMRSRQIDCFSGDDGSFELCGFRAFGTARITVLPGREWARLTTSSIALEETDLNGVELVVARAGGVAGVVVDEFGGPVPDVIVQCTNEAGEQFGRCSISGAAREARFSLGGLPAGSYRIVACSPVPEAGETSPEHAAPSFVVAGSATVELAAGEIREGVTVVCEPVECLPLFGRVTNRDGRPIAAVTMMLLRSVVGSGSSSVTIVTQTTDSEGHFSFNAEYSNEWKLWIDHKGYLPLSIEDGEGVPTGEDGVMLVLKAAGAVAGDVIDAGTRRPIERFHVHHATGEAREWTHALKATKTAFHASEGEFILERMEPGEISIVIAAPGYEDCFVTGVQVPEGGTAGPLRVELERVR